MYLNLPAMKTLNQQIGKVVVELIIVVVDYSPCSGALRRRSDDDDKLGTFCFSMFIQRVVPHQHSQLLKLMTIHRARRQRHHCSAHTFQVFGKQLQPLSNLRYIYSLVSCDEFSLVFFFCSARLHWHICQLELCQQPVRLRLPTLLHRFVILHM
jgi:hypothetical protein